MLQNAIAVYSLRVASGLGGLLTVLMVGRLYSTNGISELALFLLFFNLISVCLVWGNNIKIVDQFNHCPNSDNLGVSIIHIILNSLILLPLAYYILSHFKLWNFGLLGTLPIALAMLVSSSLISRGRSIKAVVIHEATRSLLPLLFIAIIHKISTNSDLSSLIDLSYLSLFLITPVVFIVSFQSLKHLKRCIGKATTNWLSDQLRCIPMVFPQIMFVIAAQADRLVINLLGSAEELAAYFSAQTTLSILIMAIQALTAVFTPRISEIAYNGKGSIRDESRKILFTSLGLLTLCIPGSAIYFSLIKVDVLLALKIFSMLSGSVLIGLLFGVGFQALQFSNSKKQYLMITTACLVLQFSTMIVLFNTLGVFAAALGFGAYTIATSSIAWRFWLRRRVDVAPLW